MPRPRHRRAVLRSGSGCVEPDTTGGAGAFQTPAPIRAAFAKAGGAVANAGDTCLSLRCLPPSPHSRRRHWSSCLRLPTRCQKLWHKQPFQSIWWVVVDKQRDWAQAGPSVLSEAENGTTSHHPGGAGHEPKGQFGPDRPVLLARPLGCPCGSDAVASWVRVAPLDPWRVDSYSGDAARLYLEPPRGSPLPGPPRWCPGLDRNRGIDRLFLAGQPLLNKATAPGRSLKAGC